MRIDPSRAIGAGAMVMTPAPGGSAPDAAGRTARRITP